MKKAIFILLVAFVLSVFVIPVGSSAADENITVGVVIPYEIGWFSAFRDGFEMIAEKENVNVVWQYHDYRADEETNAIQNLIIMGVDAINLTAVTPSSAEYSCRLANEAGIPIQITESGIAEGAGKPFADIDFNWFDVYYTVAHSLREDVPGELKVVWIQGFAGTPPVMQGIQGFMETIEDLDGISLATDVQYGDYATAPSLDIMKTLVQAGVDFNVAMGASQEITEGIIQGLREENVDLEEVTIVSVNGGPMDIENLRRGYLDFVLSLSPGLHGMICAQNLINYMKGETYQEKSYSPIVWCSQDDWEETLIPWYLDESWFPVVEEFVETGEYVPELRS